MDESARRAGRADPTRSTTHRADAEALIGRSAAATRLRAAVRMLAANDASVLLAGPSGSGKELTARAIHARSARRNGPFIAVNCAALEPTILASQLFGHVRGAFTGAVCDTLGFFRAAEGGTILLDEISEADTHTQAALLRVLDRAEVTPLGSTKTYPVNVRIMATTNKPLEKLISQGKFRADLFFRLNVVRVDVPPLSARRDDIPLLLCHFSRHFARRFGQPIKTFADDAIEALCGYNWPGNIRELMNLVHSLYALNASPIIELRHLPRHFRIIATVPQAREIPTLECAQRELIARALRACGGVRAHTAAMLGISRQRLLRLIKRYGLH